MSEVEEWRPWREGTYEVSNLGRVRRCKPGGSARVGRILKLGLSGNGYMIFGAYRSGVHTNVLVHRAVAECFLPPPTEDQIEVNHKDGVKSNCLPSNLEWETKSGNMKHAFATGLAKPNVGPRESGDDHWTRRRPELVKRGNENGARLHPEKIKRGKDCPASRLTEADVIRARELVASGQSYSAVGRLLNVTHQTIRNIIIGFTWRHL